MRFDPGVWPFYSEECRRDVDVLLSQGGSLSAYRANPKFGEGPKDGSWAWRLERALEEKFKAKHAVVTNSGTAALHCGLFSCPDVRGGEVIVSPYTFSATVTAILHAGGIPRFADVDPHTYCITKETVSRVLSKKTKAILPVHIFGRFGGIDDLREFGLPVIEDACQAVGSQFDGAYAGTRGYAGAFSFNGAKNVPAGECGAMVTGSEGRAHQARLLANHAENFGTSWVGYNYRPNEVTCCIAWHGLQQVHTRNFERMALARRLTGTWVSLYGDADQINAPGDFDGRHVYYVYPFKVYKHRSRFIKRMKERGINVGGGYVTPPLHHYKAFRKYTNRALPVVDELSFKTLCLLDCVRPPATLADMDYVAQAMEESLS